MKFLNYVYLAIRRSEPGPQDLAGILWQVGQELGLDSEADQKKFPTLAELSESLQALIEAGRIVELSAHRYREATYGSVARNFSGVSAGEYEKACAAYFQRIVQDHTHGWNLDLAEWPGPDRARWGMKRNDLVLPSPDGQHACVLYSCAEIRFGWTVGLLALLKGPPERPTVILRPPNFTCTVDCGQTVQWLDGGRYCVVVPYLFNSAENRLELLAFTFLDLADESFTHYEKKDILEFIGRPFVEQEGVWVIPAAASSQQSSELRIDPKQLEWQSWRCLTGTSESPPPDLLGGQLFIETPY
jgi:hypothetical protein